MFTGSQPRSLRVLRPARGQRSEAGRDAGSRGQGACGRGDAALSAHRSLCRACFCVVVHPVSHLYYQHTQSAVPEPVIRPWRPSPLTLALSPRSPPGGRVGVRPLCASGSHRPVGPGLPCSPLSPLWLSSPCLSPRRVRLLSSQPLCWRPTPHTHADPALPATPVFPTLQPVFCRHTQLVPP